MPVSDATPPQAGGVAFLRKNTMQILLVLFFLFFCQVSTVPAAMPGAGGRLQLTRDAAVAMAVHRNLDLRVQALNSSLAEERVKRSTSFYDPYLSVSSRYGETAYPGETFGTTSTNTSIDLSQYVPTGGNIAAQVQTGYTSAESLNPGVETKDWLSSVGITVYQPLLKDAGREATELNITLSDSGHRETLENFRYYLTDTIFSVISNYNRLFVLRQKYQTRRQALESAEKLRTDLLSRKAAGQKVRAVEIANADYAISQRRQELIDDGKRVRDQEASLRYLLGIEDGREILPVDSPSREEPPESEEEALRIAIENRSDLKQLRLSLAASELEERVSQHQLLPNLDLTVSGGFSGEGNVIGDSFDQITDGKGGWWSAGVAFSMPLGNTAAESDHRQNQIRSRQLRNQIRAYEWKIRDGVAEDMRALISARLQMRAADKSLRYAEQRLTEYRKKLGSGGRSVQDLLDADKDLVSARNSQIEAVDSFAYAVARLWRNMGVLLDKQHIHIDSSDPEKLTRAAEQGSAGESALVAQGKAVVEASRAAAVSVSKTTVPVMAPKSDEKKTQTSASPAENQLPRPAPAGAPVANGRILVGEYFSMNSLHRAEKVLDESGLSGTAESGPKKPHTMIRLLMGTYPNAKQAREQISRLGKFRGEGFILGSRAKGYSVFAGSHLTMDRALAEQKRLAATGVETTPVEARVAMPTWRLTLPAPRERAAQETLNARLRKLGFSPRFLPVETSD